MLISLGYTLYYSITDAHSLAFGPPEYPSIVKRQPVLRLHKGGDRCPEQCAAARRCVRGTLPIRQSIVTVITSDDDAIQRHCRDGGTDGNGMEGAISIKHVIRTEWGDCQLPVTVLAKRWIGT
ncbi:MAG: hypothetical protein AB8B64_27505 [Granulosicoccus sp.]